MSKRFPMNIHVILISFMCIVGIGIILFSLFSRNATFNSHEGQSNVTREDTSPLRNGMLSGDNSAIEGKIIDEQDITHPSTENVPASEATVEEASLLHEIREISQEEVSQEETTDETDAEGDIPEELSKTMKVINEVSQEMSVKFKELEDMQAEYEALVEGGPLTYEEELAIDREYGQRGGRIHDEISRLIGESNRLYAVVKQYARQGYPAAIAFLENRNRHW